MSGASLNGVGTHYARMEGYDSTLLAWVASPPFSGAGGGGGSTQVSVSSVAGVVVIAGNSTAIQGTSPWTIAGNSTVVQGTSPWTVAGNSTVVPVRSSTTTRSSVTQTSTSVTFSNANANRLMWTCANNAAQNADLRLKFGATASTADYDVIIPAGYNYEMPQPIYTGRIDGIWHSTGAGFARVTEWTA